MNISDSSTVTYNQLLKLLQHLSRVSNIVLTVIIFTALTHSRNCLVGWGNTLRRSSFTQVCQMKRHLQLVTGASTTLWYSEHEADATESVISFLSYILQAVYIMFGWNGKYGIIRLRVKSDLITLTHTT